VAAGDRVWLEQAVAAPLRQATGSDAVTVRTVRGGGLPSQQMEIVGGQPRLLLTARTGLAADAPMIEAVVPLDGALLRGLARHRHLAGLRATSAARGTRLAGELALNLRDAKGAVIGSLEWTPPDPMQDLRARLPAILLFFASIFGFAALYVWRQSTNIASDLMASEAQARHLAFHDMLTGMPNRAMMFDRLRQLLARSRRVYTETAVHCLDLDRFKEVNDLLGHHAGDELIRQVAEKVTALCRDTDTVARLGGDEFVILQPETNAAGASHLAERVLKLFETPFCAGGGHGRGRGFHRRDGDFRPGDGASRSAAAGGSGALWIERRRAQPGNLL
jgi:GGDEF domain-containing protein